MSELKVYHCNEWHNEYTEFYIKSEADKVIEELKRQIEFLKVTTDSCKNCAQCADGMGKVFDKEFNPLKDKLRREKYKRCLAMAEACMHKRWRPDEGFDYARSTRHMKKWLELAEKFKEAK